MKSEIPLTEPQRKLLLFMVDKLRETGHMPSFRGMMEYMELKSTNGVECHITALEKKGYIRRGKSPGTRGFIDVLGLIFNPVCDDSVEGRRLQGVLDEDCAGERKDSGAASRIFRGTDQTTLAGVR